MRPTEMTHDEWKAEGARRFGPDINLWRFQCPACRHVYSVQEATEAGMGNATAFSCIGRYVGAKRPAFGGKGDGPCNYAGRGLFRLNPIHVVMPDGNTIQSFAFADPDPSSPDGERR